MLTEHGVVIAPRTFHAWAVRAPSKRSLWDATITKILAGYYEPDEHGRKKPESLYGSLKTWAHLQREGFSGRLTEARGCMKPGTLHCRTRAGVMDSLRLHPNERTITNLASRSAGQQALEAPWH